MGLLSSCNAQASHCGGASVAEYRLLGSLSFSSAACGLSTYSLWAPEHELSLFTGVVAVWHGNLLGPGIEPVSSALESSFFTTGPRGML